MLSTTLLVLASAALSTAHTVITYPGWRGDNLITNSSFPYGMQWMYPCGGIALTSNRTYWSVKGGAVAVQPGWFQGHEKATLYVNLGIGSNGPDDGPANMSLPMVPAFGITGPSKNPYPGTVCLPQVPLPAGLSVKAGDKATIQVVELAVHGAALYSCVDIEFTEVDDPRLAPVNESNCFNSTEIGFADIYTTKNVNTNITAGSGAMSSRPPSSLVVSFAGLMPLLGMWALL